MIYRKDIDGLRSVAVVPVVWFHSGLPGFTGGYIGVDVFFVISGFLITALLLEDLENNRFSIIKFYERRARRIMPALTLVVFVTTVLAALLLQPARLEEYGAAMLATAFFGANIYFWQTTDYFSTSAEERPLLHMWSLAVEEQFYIVFPLVLLALWRWRRGGSDSILWATFLGAAMISFALACLASGWKPIANFYLPVTRAWELLAGSVVALLLKGRTPEKTRYGPVLAGLGLLLVLASLLWIDDSTPWPGPWTIVPVAGTVLILRFSHPDCVTGRLLGLKPMVWIGLLSYSIYLWHQPLFAFARTTASGHPTQLSLAMLALATVPLAWVSWRFVERPFRTSHGKGGYSRRTIFTASFASIAIMAAIGSLPMASPQLTETVFTARLSTEARDRYYMQREAVDTELFSAIGSVEGDPCRQRFEMVTPEAEEILQRCTADGARAVVVTGGSHAIDLFQALARTSDSKVIFGFARGFCRPHRRLVEAAPHDCPFEGLSDLIAADPNRISLVVYTQAGFTFFEEYREVRSPDGLHYALVEEVGEFLGQLAQHVPVVAVGPKPMLGIDVRNLAIAQPFETQIAAAHDVGIASVMSAVDDAFEAALGPRGVTYLPHAIAIGTLLPQEAIVGEKLTYRDQDHWSVHGLQVFGPRVVSVFHEMGYGSLFPPR